MADKKAQTIEETVIKVLRRREYQKGGASELRIVRWTVDGKTHPAQLERREKYQSDHGEKLGKSKGLSVEDVTFILTHKDEIIALMLGQASAPASAAPTQANPPTPAGRPSPF